MDQDLIVVDGELANDAASAVAAMADNLTDSISRYCAVLDYIMGQAVCDELFKSRLQGMKSQLEPLCGPLQAIRESCAADLRGFVGEIDRVDELSY
jgi:hypothetical protein